MIVPKSMATPAPIRIENLPCVFPHAAGLDIGSAEIVAALPPDCDVTVVRTFTTFTTDLHRLVTWLLAHGIDTVAMESTGVYWIPIYELLEAAAIPGLSCQCAPLQNRAGSEIGLQRCAVVAKAACAWAVARLLPTGR